MTGAGDPPAEPLEIVDAADGTVWRFDAEFLRSNWTCVWGNGCQGILDVPAEALQQGCCSVGAMLREDEAMEISARAAMVAPERFQNHEVANNDGIFRDDKRDATALHNNACIFFNEPGFAGRTGCALHLEAEASGESPTEWKPSVCWQSPIKIDWTPSESAPERTAHLRAWKRSDWLSEGDAMAWLCTDEPDAYVGDVPVVESLEEELRALAGDEVYVELRRRITGHNAPPQAPPS
jgi:hypothetical protein